MPNKQKLERNTGRFVVCVDREILRLAHLAAHANGKYLTELVRDYIQRIADGELFDARKSKKL